MNKKNERVIATPAMTAQTEPAMEMAGDAPEQDFTPKQLSPLQSLIFTAKLVAIAGVVFGLLWLAHVKLEK